MNEAWFNCGVGVAGDMLLAALVDAGADPNEVIATVGGLGIDGYSLSFERVHRGSLAATYSNVTTEGRHADAPDPSHAGTGDHPQHHHTHDHPHHPHRPVREILALLRRAELPDRVRRRALHVFEVLGRAEGEVHDIDPGDVELHEVGSLDAIVDVVGVCAALEALDIERITCSPVGVGYGSTMTAHGRLTTPAPAVTRMLAAHQVDVVGLDTALEVATPTGVALMVALAERFGAAPSMAVERTGFGAGTANPADRPNVVNVLVGTSSSGSPHRAIGAGAGDGAVASESLVQIETNVDDVTGEVLAHTITTLLAAGARDAWATPVVMKKGRPAHTIHALATPTDAGRLTELLLTETGSLGARRTDTTRTVRARKEVHVDLDGHRIRVKRAGARMKVEFDDAVAAADALDRPVREILREAESLAAQHREA